MLYKGLAREVLLCWLQARIVSVVVVGGDDVSLRGGGKKKCAILYIVKGETTRFV